MRKPALFWLVPASLACGCGTGEVPAVEATRAALYSCPFDGLTTDEKAAFGIQHVECRQSADGDPNHDYSYAVGCFHCPGAVYLSTGALTNGPSLTHIPTGWKLLVPANWNGRMVARVPGGAVTLVLPAPWFDMMLAEGYAVVTINHPEPFTPDIPVPPPDYHPREFGDSYVGAGVQLRALVSALFSPVERFYGFGLSRGMASGMGPILGRADSPYDGYVVGLSGHGRIERMELNDRIWRSAPSNQKQPCVDLGTQISKLTQAEAENLLRQDLRIFDHSYPGPAFGYDWEAQSEEVQERAEGTIAATDLQRPTIYVHGLLDGIVPPILGARLIAKIVRDGKGDLVRPYFFKTRAHGQAPGQLAQLNILDQTFHDLMTELDRWVRGEGEPGPVRELVAADETTPRQEAGCRTRLQGASWDATHCRNSPYDFDDPDLQACPSPLNPKVQSCPAWACFFAVQQGE